MSYSVGQLIYDEYYGLGIICKVEGTDTYIEYKIEFCQQDSIMGYDSAWFEDSWVEKRINEPCLIPDKT